MLGGMGDDFINGFDGRDEIDGGDGFDIAEIDQGEPQDVLRNIEKTH